MKFPIGGKVRKRIPQNWCNSNTNSYSLDGRRLIYKSAAFCVPCGGLYAALFRTAPDFVLQRAFFIFLKRVCILNRNLTYRLSIYAGLFTAAAYIAAAVLQVNVVMFLSYEPKDIVIALGGFIFGPFFALAVSLGASFIEMLTVSSTGIIGFFMNFISSAAFACTASFIYRKSSSDFGAVLGLIVGSASMTVSMLLWNYIVTPIYLGYSREVVASMLLPVFLPFNIIKSGLNASFTILLYNPVTSALKSSGFAFGSSCGFKKKNYICLAVSSFLTAAVCIFSIFMLK